MITIYGQKTCGKCHDLFNKLTTLGVTRPIELRYLEAMEDTDTRDDVMAHSVKENNGMFPIIDMYGVLVNEVELMKYLELGKETGVFQ